MLLARSLSAPLAALLAAQAPAVPALQPGAQAADPSARDDTAAEAQAAALRDARRFVSSARLYEQLWSDRQVPKYMVDAAISRELAGQDAHAYVHLRGYLALPDLDAGARAEAERRLAALQRRSLPIRITVRASGVPSSAWRLTLQRTDASQDALELDPSLLSSAGASDVLLLHVEPGSWRVRATAPDREPSEAAADFAPGHTPELVVRLRKPPPPPVTPVPVALELGPRRALDRGIDLTLTPEGPSVPPQSGHVRTAESQWQLAPGRWTLRLEAPGHTPQSLAFAVRPPRAALRVELLRERDRMTLGLALAAGLSAVAGAAMFAGGRVWFDKPLEAAAMNQPCVWDPSSHVPADPSLSPCREAAVSHGLDNAGAALLGASPGFAVGAILASQRDRLASRKVWGTQLGLSLAGLGASLPWLVHSNLVFQRDGSKGSDRATISAHMLNTSLASAAAGMAASLLVNAIVHLTSARLRKRAEARSGQRAALRTRVP